MMDRVIADENLELQIQELEVLSSIFLDQWQSCPKLQDTYHIKLSTDVELWVTLNPGYPLEQPPQYELVAPKFSKTQKDFVHCEFQNIYETQKGSPIIFQWIQKLEEVMHETKNIKNNETSSEKGTPSRVKAVVQLDIVHGEPITDRKSTFQGHVCAVKNFAQVREFRDELLTNKKIKDATHNILAYRIKDGQKVRKEYDDDGEHHAGGRLLHLLEMLEVENVAVIVTRWYGGIHLGNDRFKHINNAGKQALKAGGFIK